MKSRVFHPEADEEYAEAARHYAKIGPELGNRFYEEIERVLDEVCKASRRIRQIDGEIFIRSAGDRFRVGHKSLAHCYG